MALPQQHVSKRISNRRIGVGPSQQLLLFVTACLLSSIPLHYSMLSCEPEVDTQDCFILPKRCYQKCAKQVKPVLKQCRRLLLNFNISETQIPGEEALRSTNFPMENFTLSMGNVSSIISEDYMCKCYAEIHINVTDDACALSINFNESSRQSITDTLLSLKGASYVKALSLRNNSISNLGKNVFENFVKLEALDLSQNSLRTFDLTGTQFPSLIKLKLSRNKLQRIDSTLYNLKSLYIDYNNITDLSFISTFENISILNASHNSITIIPSSISNLTELTCLVLDYNKIKDVAVLQDFPLKSIYRIKISHNEIHQVNVDLTKHKKLTLLDMDSNNISYFNFTGVKSLRHLDLCNNHISEIYPPHALNGSEITSFKLCNNSLTNAAVIMLMENLVTLDLSNNKLHKLNKMFKNKLNLQKLRLLNVSLQSLDFVETLESLKVLEIDDNNITNFPEHIFQNTKCIKTFTVSNNPFERIHCPSNVIGKKIIGGCNMSFDEGNENIILDIRMKNKEINKKMGCLLNAPGGKEFLDQCSSKNSNAIKVALKHYFLLAIIFILNIR